MSYENWCTVFSRIYNRQSEDIDDVLSPFDDRVTTIGKDIFPGDAAAPKRPPLFKDKRTACIGYRVTAKPADLADVAMRLTALAMEKEVEVVIFNHLDYSDLERFGFRCEKISGQTAEERQACEDQLKIFWNVDLVL